MNSFHAPAAAASLPRKPAVLGGGCARGPDGLDLVEREGLVDVAAGVDVGALRTLLQPEM